MRHQLIMLAIAIIACVPTNLSLTLGSAIAAESNAKREARHKIWDLLQASKFSETETELKECAKTSNDTWCLQLLGLLLCFQERYAEAEPVLKSELEKSNSPVTAYRLGVALLAQHKASDAIPYLVLARKINTPEVLLTLASAYLAMDRREEAIATYEEVSKLHPNTKHSYEAAGYAEVLEAEPGLKKSDPDYFKFATTLATTRWAAKKMPLKVFIQDEEAASAVPGYRPEFRSILMNAFESWLEASQGDISFTFVNSVAAADIQCKWLGSPKDKKDASTEGGHTIPKFYDDGIKSADIVLRTQFDSIPVTRELMRAVCLHEVGHALGIVSHSPYPGDIMFGSVVNSVLTQRDKETLRHLYRSDVRLSTHTEMIQRVSKYATEQEKVMMQAVSHLSNENYDAAIKKMQEVIAINKDNAIAANAWDFIGVCYLFLKKTEEAETCFKTALAHPELRPKDRRRCLNNYASLLHRLKREDEAKQMKAAAEAVKVPEEE